MLILKKSRSGLTLLELIVVLVILVALAGVLVPLIGSSSDDARQTATRATLKNLRDAVLAYAQDMKGVQVGTGTFCYTTGLPRTLADLQKRPTDDKSNPVADFDPLARRGWRGPYLLQSTGKFDKIKLDASFAPYGNQDDPAFLDSWGAPIVLQLPAGDALGQYARLVSAGPPLRIGGVLVSVINTPKDETTTLTQDKRGNDLVLFLRIQDPYP